MVQSDVGLLAIGEQNIALLNVSDGPSHVIWHQYSEPVSVYAGQEFDGFSPTGEMDYQNVRASYTSGTHHYMLTRNPGSGFIGMWESAGLIGINLTNGEQDYRINLGDRSPYYKIDEANGLVFSVKGGLNLDPHGSVEIHGKKFMVFRRN